jgi:hypothetical protein
VNENGARPAVLSAAGLHVRIDSGRGGASTQEPLVGSGHQLASATVDFAKMLGRII